MPHCEPERQIELRQARCRLTEIRAFVYTQRKPMDGLEYCITGTGRGPEKPPERGWKPFQARSRWGGLDETTWFRMRAVLPTEYRGKCAVALLRIADLTYIEGVGPGEESGDALAYVNSVATQGIDRNHDDIVLTPKARGGERFEIALEACPGPRFETYHVFQYADIAVFNPLVWDFYWDATVALDVAETMERDSATRRRLLQLVTKAVFMADLQHGGDPAFSASLAAAQKTLRADLREFEASFGMGNMALIGHSHIDTAWLWPLRETRRKVSRTWSTVLRLMERYPEYLFSASQPALYEFLKENHPELWKQLKKRVKEGRWEPCGATWVEQDSNVPSGEALVRQFLYGNRFLEREFGMRSRTAWLPDAFGFPWTLPQIMRKAQIDNFHTIKIFWSRYTRFPYNFFQWQGLDGTRIPASMPFVNYNGNPVPSQLIEQWKNFEQKDLVDEVPFSFGWGDGGGGPTKEMIEYGRRLKNIAGAPKCQFSRTQDCLDRMVASCDAKAMPTYNGELYLEFHRGCQTTQARTKRLNRKSEFLLHDTEWLSSLAMLLGGKYEQQTLLEAWRIVLTNQFHDILPGSSITEVYKVAEDDYARAQALALSVRNDALAHLAAQIDTTGPGQPIIVFNPLSWVRSDVVRATTHLPKGIIHVIGPDGQPAPCQRAGNNEILFEAYNLPPLGYAVYHAVPGQVDEIASGTLKASAKVLENDFVRVRIDGFGRFTSVYDKIEEREVLAPGERGNVLQLFDDRPHGNDAWDIDHNFAAIAWEPGKAVSLEVIEEGPVRAIVRVVRKTEKSTITQDITLYAISPRIEVATRVDWHEKHALMKVAFPVDVLASRATYHIQYGIVDRATHDNTDFDRARFEVPAQHWADLSEGDYGVSLINDCKYGYDVKGNVLRLSLLRAPADPDPHADEGAHEFAYALYPHAGDWRYGTVQQGFEMNNPCIAVEAAPVAGTLPKMWSFAVVSEENVILDAVKKAEDTNAFILRVYEAYGQRGDVMITLGKAPRKVFECDLMEENDTAVSVTGNSFTFYVKPYEIRTFKIIY